jgi:hypothetical protein
MVAFCLLVYPCIRSPCAADAAFRAVQPKVAITRWLRLHQKEGLYQEEKITARISGKSQLRRTRQKILIPCVGGGGQQIKWFCFRSDNKQTKSKRFAFVLIINGPNQ